MLSLKHLDVCFGDGDHLRQNFLYVQVLYFIPAVVVVVMMMMMVNGDGGCGGCVVLHDHEDDHAKVHIRSLQRVGGCRGSNVFSPLFVCRVQHMNLVYA